MFPLLIAAAVAGSCPTEPALRDGDGEVKVLAQNLKFIFTGGKRKERDRLLASYLEGEGSEVDMLLLSEARLTSSFEAWRPGWCFYTQRPSAELDGYRWAPIREGRPPGGLAMGVRQRAEGALHALGAFAGRAFRARPTSLAEGLLGRIFRFEKGWAGVEIDGTRLVWSHAQASYRVRPERGAGDEISGRAAQFDQLAADLGRREHATLLTGDLNLLEGFRPQSADDESRVESARAIDAHTIARFRERTGINLLFPWFENAGAARGASEAGESHAGGTFAGAIDRRRAGGVWDVGAAYDRVGVNEAFLEQHPGTKVRRVEIRDGWLGVSDHMGLEISIPFSSTTLNPAAPSPASRKPTARSPTARIP